MDRNVSRTEGVWRTSLGFALMILAWDAVPFLYGTPYLWLCAVVAALSVVLLWTGLARTCPAYAALGIDRARSHDKAV